LSKTLAEREAWKIAGEHGLDLVTINPSLVIGPPASSRVDGTSIGGVKGLMEGRERRSNFCVVDVRDVCEAHIAAMERCAIELWRENFGAQPLTDTFFGAYADPRPRADILLAPRVDCSQATVPRF
jgi:nucleoside-diphosphate-sugar epimerase